MEAWFYYDVSGGETQWDHPLDQLYREKVVSARAGGARSHHSETDPTIDLPQDEVTGSNSRKEILDKHVKNKLNVDVDENTEISVDTCEILEQSERAMMPLVRLRETSTG